MAGIGFELRKIYGKKTLLSSVAGSFYAIMSTIGPAIIFITALLIIRWLLSVYGVSILIIDFFVSSFTYNFLIALLISSAMTAVLSRYISDKVFEEKPQDIAASLLGMMVITTMIAAVCGGILCFFMYVKDKIPLPFLFVYYLLCIAATNMYNVMTYVSALKEYKEIAIAFAAGFGVGTVSFLLLNEIAGLPIIMSLYIAILAAITSILMILVILCIKSFGKISNDYFGFLKYYKKYYLLVITGFCYMFGFFVSNIAYWIWSDMQVKIGVFITAPSYDMAMFLAIIINMPALVIFVVKIETAFSEANMKYLSALNKANYTMIQKSKESMNNILNLQLFYIYDIQLIVSILMICLIGIVFPYLGISSQTVNMFMILGMAIYCIISMYFTIIIMYYFEDYKRACFTACSFLLIEVILLALCIVIKSPYYPIPALIAGIVSWGISFLLLRNRLKNINQYLLCR